MVAFQRQRLETLRPRKICQAERYCPPSHQRMTSFFQALQRQPEYIHVLLNPLPIYGLAMGWIGLMIAAVLRSRSAQIATLVLILIGAASAWPVYEFGEQGYDRVLSMTDEDGHAWLDEHQHRGEQLIYFFYALAALSVIAIILPIKWPETSGPLVIGTILSEQLFSG